MEEHTINSIKSFTKDLKRHFLMSILFMVLYFAVSFIGALIFFYIEHCYDATPPKMNALTKNYFQICKLMEAVTHQGNQTLQNTGNTTTNATLIKVSLDACGKDKLQFQAPKCDLDTTNWIMWVDYINSIGYTIGYGVVVTRSQTGRMATILYAIPAIGVTMTMNIFIGNIFVDCTKILLVLFYTKVLKQQTIHNLPRKVFCYQAFLAVFVCVLSGYTSQKIAFEERITFIDGIYFSFVTFSTIGFGDMYVDHVRQEEIEPLPHACLMIIFFIGMGVVASALSGLSQLFTEKRSKKDQKIWPVNNDDS